MTKTVTTENVINLPPNQVWERLSDLSLAHNYVPGIIKTEIVTSEIQGVGTSRRVYQGRSRFLQETVIDWREGGGFTLRLHKGERDSPFKNSRFDYHIEPNGDAQTQADATKVILTMSYEPPLGIVGDVMDRLLLHGLIQKAITDVGLSMKHYYETGLTPSKATIKQMRR